MLDFFKRQPIAKVAESAERNVKISSRKHAATIVPHLRKLLTRMRNFCA